MFAGVRFQREKTRMTLLKIENLSKVFTLHNLGAKKLQGFADLSLTLPKGKVLVLSGPSGVGKSSVLKCIYRTYLPTSGHIWYDSAKEGLIDLANRSEHDMIRLRGWEIGYISQFLKVLPRVSAVDVVAEPLVRAGMAADAAGEKAADLLLRLNIPFRLHDAFPVTFSGGEQQRVNIARAIIRRPRLLLLDEPTASLDADSIEIVCDLLGELRHAGTTMVMICHDRNIAGEMADIVLPLDGATPRVEMGRLSAPVRPSDGLRIANGDLVLPHGILSRTDLDIRDGRIAAIGPSAERAANPANAIDASNRFVMPGFIDLHSDAIEKAIEPRPRAELPLEVALTELDKSLAACGITTMHHCVCFTGKESEALRYYEQAGGMVRRIKALNGDLLVNTRIHARYEILDTECIPLLLELMDDGLVDMLSLMDHTPGQGQFTNVDYLYEYYTKASHLSREEVDVMIQRRLERSRTFDDGHLRELVQHCHQKNIPLASHDDDTPEKVAWANDLGVRISEFPVSLAAAEAAHQAGMGVLMGAPNIIFGRSLTDNLSGRLAIEQGFCNLIGSDYSPHTLLHAIFTLHKEGLGALPELVRMVSQRPASATNQADQYGTLAEGLSADLTIVDPRGPVPRITQTFRNGQQIYAAE
jgi:alpha-D-ribose 1-methylphosphonate 5-triphosphate diphosphatase